MLTSMLLNYKFMQELFLILFLFLVKHQQLWLGIIYIALIA